MTAKKMTKRNARTSRTPRATAADTPRPAPTEAPHGAATERRTPSDTEVPTPVATESIPPAGAAGTPPTDAEVRHLPEDDFPEPAAASTPTDTDGSRLGPTDHAALVATEVSTAATPAAARTARKRPRAKANREAKAKKPSALDAAARVLAEAGQPMTCPELIAAMADQGYWASPKGQTPPATLYAALLREINAKGSNARFQKAERGQFTRRTQA